MTHHDPAQLAREYVADRLSDADAVRAGRRLAIELRARRQACVRARRARLVTPIVGADQR